jgi:uncharacterized membrane protein
VITKISPVAYIIAGIVSTSIAQIGLKIGSSSEVLSKRWLMYLCASGITYLFSFVCYYLALRHYDVSKISPIMMIGTMLIITMYGFYSGENINGMRMAGIALAISCIVVMSNS